MEEAKDPGAFRQFEFSGWESSVDAYNDAFSPLTRKTIPAILDALGPLEGKRVLDVACGPGDLSRVLAEAGAQVTALDFSPAMIQTARKLNDHVGINYQEGDAETLSDLADGTYDAVVMNYGILHLGRPAEAIRAAGRVLKPGGRFVLSCWQDPTRAKGFALILDAVKQVGVAPEGIPHGPNFFTFSDNGNIEGALTEAGFANVTIRDVDQSWELNDGNALFDAFLNGTARTGGMLRKLSPEDRELVREVVVANAEALYGNSEGGLNIPMPTKVAYGDFGL